MIVKVTRQVNEGTVEFEIDEREHERALEMATFLTTKDYCNNCKTSDKIVWSSNRAKGKTDGKEYIYVKRHCFNCGADSTMGKYLSGGLFWKSFEVFDRGDGDAKGEVEKPVVGHSGASDSKSGAGPDPRSEINIEDIPF